MLPWYKVVTPRKEVREGRSFSPDEFAIALEQVVAGTAPEDYRIPEQFFARTHWTRALRMYTSMVLRRLAGRTDNTAPVLTLITQFGGGKTHTLTALYHLAKNGEVATRYAGVASLLRETGLSTVPKARVAVFVGNAWDPQPGRETPWIDIARQLADDIGVTELGSAARIAPPGTETLQRVFKAAKLPVLILFDEVLNFVNRHRDMADAFYAFLQNLTVATTSTTAAVCVISLPRSQVEMTEWDIQWQDKITKVVRRVAKDLITNDEAEISEVVRRRLFEDLGDERVRKQVARRFAEWCFERRAQLPPEWTAVDTATTEAQAREFLRRRFEACYPFHPATLSVFQRKWQALPQYQQTRGTLAMLAQWISWAYRDGFTKARREPLITLGSAPLGDLTFRSTILGQLGEPRLEAAILSDIAGEHSHAWALDADTRGPLRDIHSRVGLAILFESSGGQTDKVAHLPELRFALGEPDLDTTSIDNAAFALEDKSYFIRRVGSDGFKISYKPTLKKVVSDRRASLDEETEVKPEMRKLVEKEFKRGASISVLPFFGENVEVEDTPKLKLVVVDPDCEWTGEPLLRERVIDWTTKRGQSARLYPGALIWCFKKPGRELREKVATWLAWKRVSKEVADGSLSGEFDDSERAEIETKVSEAEEAARDEVWGGYRFVVLFDPHGRDGLRILDLGAGHASSGETLCGRVLNMLASEALVNESVGAGYIERHWPPALRESEAWPLKSLRQSFLDGSLTRLLDVDNTLRRKIVEFVQRGEFGLAFGPRPDGSYERVWFGEPISPDEVTFDADVFLLRRSKALALKDERKESQRDERQDQTADHVLEPPPTPVSAVRRQPVSAPESGSVTIRVVGTIPPEVWNRLGTKVLPRLRSGSRVRVGVDLSAQVNADAAGSIVRELEQVLEELGVTQCLRVESRDERH